MVDTASALIIPSIIQIQLVDLNGIDVPLGNVLLSIHIFAHRKNDFLLQPFVTDSGGRATITKEDIMSEVEAHYDSGLMDYVSVESAKPQVQISVTEPSQIQRSLKSRSTLWTTLLRGESRRWASIDELLDVYRNCTNDKVTRHSVTARWDLGRASAQHLVQVERRQALFGLLFVPDRQVAWAKLLGWIMEAGDHSHCGTM